MIKKYFNYEMVRRILGEDFYYGATLKKDLDAFKAGTTFDWVSVDDVTGNLHVYKDGKQTVIADFA